MRYLSVCSGIEAATVAWHPLGWEPVAFSEIEKFPCSLLAHHYPNVQNWGDMNDYRNWPDADVDVLVGGTPCQSFSVAGLRAGLADPRGNLALVYLAIAERYRPAWLVWENVPGVLSSDGGRDFASIIGGMVELGYCPSWRVLDAQYFGVAQRRRRVFVVASFGDWRPAAEVLFEPESMRGNPPPSRETGEGVAPSLAARTRGGGGLETDAELDGALIPAWPAQVAPTLNAAFASKQGLEDQHALGGAGLFVLSSAQANASHDFDVSPALTCLHEAPIVGALTAKGPEGLGAPEVDANHYLPVAFNWQNGGGYGNAHEGLGISEDHAGPMSRSQVQAVAIRTNQTSANGHGIASEVAHTLDSVTGQAIAFKPSHYTRGKDGAPSDVMPPLSADADKGDQEPVIAFGLRADASRSGEAKTPSKDAEGRLRKRDAGFNVCENFAPTLDSGQPHTVAFAQNQRDEVRLMDEAGALAAEPGAKQQTYAMQGMAVRRLTCRECERLQGFPDDYTLIPGASDSARYKALGNSMAVPVMSWLGRRIDSISNKA